VAPADVFIPAIRLTVNFEFTHAVELLREGVGEEERVEKDEDGSDHLVQLEFGKEENGERYNEDEEQQEAELDVRYDGHRTII
jgi:hypothetical protein